MATYYDVASIAGGTRTNTSLTIPASSAEGAIAIVSLYVETDVPPTPPEGFSEILAINHTSNTQQQRIYWSRLIASKGGDTATWQHASTWSAAVMIVWDDASETVNPWTGTGNQGTDSTAEALGVTPLGDDAGINYLVGAFDGWAATAPTGSTPTFTERYDANTNVYAATGVLATAGATGDKDSTDSGGADEWTAALAVVEDVAEVEANAYPRVLDIRSTIFTANTTSHNVVMPEVVNAGELLLIVFSADGNVTISAPGAWTQIYQVLNSIGKGAAFFKVADGTEDGANVDITTSGSEAAAAHVYRITDWGGTTSDVEGSGTASSNNPPSVTPSWGSDANLYIATWHASATGYVTAAPTGFNNIVATDAGSGTARAQAFSARLAEVSGSNDPGTWTAGATGCSGTIVIKPSSAPAATNQPYDKRLGGIPFARSGYYPSMARW